MRSLFAVLAAAGLLACSQEQIRSTPVTSYCVPIEDGQLYEVENGKLVAVAAPAETNDQTDPAGPEQTINRWLSSGGFSWLTVRPRSSFAILTGSAPSEVSKQSGLGAALASIANVEESADWIMVDAITTPDDDNPVGAAILTLPISPDPSTCESALSTAMSDRRIEFLGDSATLMDANDDLLNAIAAISDICREHRIEIAAHSDLRGSQQTNLVVSQNRADAVRSRLIETGVNGAGLIAVGYGESEPLDNRINEAANRTNERVEFKVSVR